MGSRSVIGICAGFGSASSRSITRSTRAMPDGGAHDGDDEEVMVPQHDDGTPVEGLIAPPPPPQ